MNLPGTAKHCWEADHNFSWDQEKVVDTESRLIPMKIKETLPSLKNTNHINKISYKLPENIASQLMVVLSYLPIAHL